MSLVRVPTKRELGVRLAEYPLLRLLLFNVWFRLALLACLLLLLALPLSLVRIWRATPAGFSPEIKISGLDWLQARSLNRTALRAEAQGQIDDARFAWQAAIANQPADPELLRGSLRSVVRGSQPPPDIRPVLSQAAWLLHLTATNHADLELACRVAEKLQFYDWELAWLNPQLDQLDPRLEAVYLGALFNAGRMDQFINRWRQRLHGPTSDPELGLYLAAYEVAWGPPQPFAEADRLLDAALSDPARGELAARLRLRVATRLADAQRGERALAFLQSQQADTLTDHAVYWQLLGALGRTAQVSRLAAGGLPTPGTALETARVAETLAALGLQPAALGLLERYAARFTPADPIWITRANLLLEAQQWENARAIALQIRLQESVRTSLAGFSAYVEGRADVAENRGDAAETAFRECAAAEFPNATLGLFVARELDRVGHATVARDLLLRLQPRFEQDPAYWRLLLAVASELKQSDLALSAAAGAYRLQPASTTAANDYAAALLLCRRQPEKALVLTLQVLAQNPESAAAKVNHSLALLQNSRPAEAKSLLRTVDARRLAGAAATMHALARFEIGLSLEDYDQARHDSERIDPQYLFPAQIERLERERRQLPPRPAG